MTTGQFKVTDFGIGQKPIHNFLLVYNTNLYPVAHHVEL